MLLPHLNWQPALNLQLYLDLSLNPSLIPGVTMWKEQCKEAISGFAFHFWHILGQSYLEQVMTSEQFSYL